MSDSCTHLDTIEHTDLPDVRVCDACIAIGSTWVHLRMCTQCGVIRCCDDSPNRHATAWGVGAFLLAGVVVPIYIVRVWLRRRRGRP